MRNAPKIKKAAKKEVVVDAAVPLSFPTNDVLKGYLDRAEHHLEELDEFFTRVDPKTGDPINPPPDAQKLFLHKSVSRFKPPPTQLKKWIRKLTRGPMGVLRSTGCLISFSQPNTRRPSRTFRNPQKPVGKYAHNDGIGIPAVVLLSHGIEPVNEHDEASHLCGHSRCCRLEHLRWEPTAVNFSRNECHLYGLPCTHDPPCIPLNVTDVQIVAAKLKTLKKQKH